MGAMAMHKATEDSTEAEAKAFIAENEPLLERATPATLHRIILHGVAIGEGLSDEIVAEMKEKADALNSTAGAINDPATSPARIQELEEERMRVQAQQSTKQETFEALSEVMERAITLRQEREEPDAEGTVVVHETPIASVDEMRVFNKAHTRRGFFARSKPFAERIFKNIFGG